MVGAAPYLGGDSSEQEASIRRNKCMAKTEISNFIDVGLEIVSELSNSVVIKTEDDFDVARARFEKWSNNVLSLVTISFDNESMADEYEGLPSSTTDMGESFSERKRNLKTTIERRVSGCGTFILKLIPFPNQTERPGENLGLKDFWTVWLARTCTVREIDQAMEQLNEFDTDRRFGRGFRFCCVSPSVALDLFQGVENSKEHSRHGLC